VPTDTTHRKVTSTPSSLTKADLQSAIEKEELEPWFQPVINMQTGEFVGVEMLARWPWEEGNVYPDEFIPLAEEYD
jgi:sensor c-di-GMP phosphodiesterase-like protein